MSRNDTNSPDWVRSASLNSSGYPINSGATTFVHQPMMGFNHFSITAQTSAGSTAAGTLTVQCTDNYSRAAIADASVPWVDMNYPGTNTPITITIASGQNSYNVQVSNVACKCIRLRWASSSGTGTLNAGITCRANSR